MNTRSPRAFFISYSRKDAAVVHPVVQMMRATGSHVFRDEENISPGARWRDVLAQSLRDADVIVVFWSKNSANSSEVAAECDEAASLGKDIIPVLLDDQPLSSALSQFQFIDFRPMTGMGSPWHYILHCLAESILRRLDSEPVERNIRTLLRVYDVFIAHTSNGASEAVEVGNELQGEGLTVFYWDIPQTESTWLSSETYLQMRSSRFVFLVISRADVHNSGVAAVGTAITYMMPTRAQLILVDCEHPELSHGLRGVQALNFHDRDKWQGHLVQWIKDSKDTQQTGT